MEMWITFLGVSYQQVINIVINTGVILSCLPILITPRRFSGPTRSEERDIKGASMVSLQAGCGEIA